MSNWPRTPLDEAFARWPHTPRVEARIRRFNPDGLEEGHIPRGWNPAQTMGGYCIIRHLIPISRFNKLYGKGAHRALPKEAFRKCGGKRRAIMCEYFDHRQSMGDT